MHHQVFQRINDGTGHLDDVVELLLPAYFPAARFDQALRAMQRQKHDTRNMRANPAVRLTLRSDFEVLGSHRVEVRRKGGRGASR